VTANAYALRHFIEMRADPAADLELLKMALALLERLQAEGPNPVGDSSVIVLPDGG
jgi:thymidylate synthase (FAD)